MHEVSFDLPVPLSFRLDATVWVLRRRQKNLIDGWDGRTYSRVLVFDDAPVKLTASLDEAKGVSRLNVGLQSAVPLTASHQTEAAALLQKVFGLSVNVAPFYAMTEQSPALDRLAKQFIGVRPTRYPTVFEALVNAVACQQVSLDAGIALLNRLSATFGPGLPGDDGAAAMHAFPRPEDVLDVPEGDLKQLGFSYQKARTIKEVAYRVVNGDVDAAKLETASNEEIAATLQAIRGIGRWSAEYVLLRGFGRIDVFPGDDVGGQNNVRALLGMDSRPDYAGLKTLTAAWSPYAGFVYFHLLLDKLHGKGLI